MEMENNNGVTADDSTRNENTIITRDAALIEEGQTVIPDHISSTTEPIHTMDELVGRGLPLPSFDWNLSDAAGKCIQTLYLPEHLYGVVKESINMLPFRSFVHSNYDMELRFKVNANKFQAGKLIAAIKNDSYQADAMASLMESAFMRPHVVLDAPSCNEGQLNIGIKSIGLE